MTNNNNNNNNNNNFCPLCEYQDFIAFQVVEENDTDDEENDTYDEDINHDTRYKSSNETDEENSSDDEDYFIYPLEFYVTYMSHRILKDK